MVVEKKSVDIPISANQSIQGDLVLPPQPKSLIIFSHGSGSSRHSPRNQYVASVLNQRQHGTLLLDLLTPSEDLHYEKRFDIKLLANRLQLAIEYCKNLPETASLKVGLFGASTGAASALIAACSAPITAVVSRGGRVDLAGDMALQTITCPVLMLVGSLDVHVLRMNRECLDFMSSKHEAGLSHELKVINGATHLFEEPGTLEEVASDAAAFFDKHCK